MAAGMSRARLDRVHDVLAGHVARGALPGLVALVSRHGEAEVEAIGTLAVDDRTHADFWTTAYTAIDD